MQFKLEQGELEYNCSVAWDADSSFRLSESKIKYVRDRKIVDREDEQDKFLFSVFHPITRRIEMPDIFTGGRWRKPRFWIVGRGPTVERAEASALARLEEISACDHSFHLADDSMSGDAVCSRCEAFVPEYFLNSDIHFAKYKSLERHGEDEVEPGIKYRTHLAGTTTEMSFDPHLSKSEKVCLMCAGWMHHADGIPTNQMSEKILKYFHLEPGNMYESLVLSYYDCVDMIKSLLNSKNHNALTKYKNKAIDLVKDMQRIDLPHCGFLESYILMAEQTIFSDATA